MAKRTRPPLHPFDVEIRIDKDGAFWWQIPTVEGETFGAAIANALGVPEDNLRAFVKINRGTIDG